MRVGRGAGLVLALTLGACRTQELAAPADAGLPPPLAPAAGTTHRCEALLPRHVRELALPGFDVKEDTACATCGPRCTFRSAAEPGITVSLAYDCAPRAPSADVRELLAPTLNSGGVEVPALGRAAARRTPVMGMLQVVAWDDDTPCVLIVTWLGGGSERAVEVMRTALLAATTTAVAEAHPPDAGTP
ncbi:MAG: hypothetical protein JXB05_38555 [Myxococcaceae bacterium]|nr:hypothetical protein [Myxococcaceae bacterium]